MSFVYSVLFLSFLFIPSVYGQSCENSCRNNILTKTNEFCNNKFNGLKSADKFSNQQILDRVGSFKECSVFGNLIKPNYDYVTNESNLCIDECNATLARAKADCESAGGSLIEGINGELNCQRKDDNTTGCLLGDSDCVDDEPQPGFKKCYDNIYVPKDKDCPRNGNNYVECLSGPKVGQLVSKIEYCNSGSDPTPEQPQGDTVACNVSGVIIQLEAKTDKTAAENKCKEIQTAHKDTTSTPGHEDALSLDITQLAKSVQSCEKKAESAQVCCGDPYSCIGGGEPGSNTAMAVLGSILQGGNKLIAGGTASITSACKTLKNLGRSASAINAAMSQKCKSYVDTCKSDCRKYQDPLANMKSYYENEKVCKLKSLVSDSDLNRLLTNTTEIYKKNCNHRKSVAGVKDIVTASLVSCNSSGQQISKMINDSIGTQSIAEFANKCQDMSSSKNDYAQDPSAPFEGDCTNPAHYSNPICVQCRLDPSAQQCAGINLGNNGAQANNNGNGIVEENSDNDDLLGVSGLGTMGANDENPGLGDPSAIAPSGTSLASSGTGGGGGGGLGQDNIQALGTDPSQDGGAGGSGYNTNILGNASGGGGYTTSSMGYGSGGGYSGRITTDLYENTPPTGIMKDGFDLREYLPGGKAYKGKSRLPAGYIQLPDGEVIGPKHGNIFHMMHERYAYYESLGKFWPANYSKEKIECIKKSGIMNNEPYVSQWSSENLHKPTPIPNPPQCRHFADHDPNKPDPTQIYLKAQIKNENKSRTPQSIVASYKDKSLHEIYHALTRKKDSFSKQQYSALYSYYKKKYAEYNKSKSK